jgi:hypothetical protein
MVLVLSITQSIKFIQALQQITDDKNAQYIIVDENEMQDDCSIMFVAAYTKHEAARLNKRAWRC